MSRKPEYLRVSFAFTAEDKEILVHCAKASGLTQTEVVRRLTRHYASGGDVTGCTAIPNEKRAKAWRKAHATAG